MTRVWTDPEVGEIDLEHGQIGRGEASILLSGPSRLPGHQTRKWWHCPPPLDKVPWLEFSQATGGLGPGSFRAGPAAVSVHAYGEISPAGHRPLSGIWASQVT